MATPTKINSLLIPNVTKLPSQKNVETANKLNPGETSEFKNLLDTTLEQAESESSIISQMPKGLNLSAHAMRRLQERNLNIDKEEFSKLQSAMDKLKIKGGQDSLVITNKAAYILDVAKNMIVTAIDKDNIAENVFTKIDSTILMN